MTKMSEEEYKKRRKEYSRDYYLRKKKKKIELGLISDNPQTKRSIKEVKKPSYIKVTKLNNGIIVIEATTRKFKTTPYDRYCDYFNPKSLYHRKKRLESMLYSINKENRIIVLDDYTVQIFLKTENNLQEITDTLKEFVEESVKLMHEDLE